MVGYENLQLEIGERTYCEWRLHPYWLDMKIVLLIYML